MQSYQRKRRKRVAEINVVPYIDVMLVLLIIFMATAPVITQGVKVDLPQAEAEMLPHEPIEGQFIAQQFRLLRAARAFLDPALNLGLMSRAEAERILREEALFSPGMTKQELDRYQFRMPGQAGSYYYGYRKLIDLRVETEVALGAAFNERAFNDFLLSQGIIPLDLIAKAVREEFIPSQVAGG